MGCCSGGLLGRVRLLEYCLGRLQVEILLVGRFQGAVGLHFFECVVGSLAKRVVLLRVGWRQVLPGVVGLGHLESVQCLGGLLGPGEIEQDGIDLAGDERVERVIDLGIAAQVVWVGVLLDVVLAGGALLDPDRAAFEVVDRPDIAALLYEERLLGQEPWVAEVDDLLTLGQDRGACDRGIELLLG
jgi:hypothetical protein